jgi:hypothetical protein
MEEFQAPEQNVGVKKAFGCLLVAAALGGCATNGAGNAPRGDTGSARKPEGERFRTETLTPGIGSALFPDPAWK